MDPIPKEMYSGTPLYFHHGCLCREKRKRGVQEEKIWIGVKEMFWDRIKTLIWKNCVHTVKGMTKKMEVRKDLPNRRKQQQNFQSCSG